MVHEILLTSVWLPIGVTGWALLFFLIMALGWKKWKTTKEYARMFDTEEDPETVKVYRDKFGNRWYTYKDPKKLPADRLLSAEMALKYAQMNITPEALLQWIEKMVESLNAGDIQEIGHSLGKIRERMDYASEEVTLLNLAKCYFFMKGENPKKVSDEWNKRKEEVWKEDDNCRAFFLVASWRLIHDASETSDKQILEYLREVKGRLNEKGQ